MVAVYNQDSPISDAVAKVNGVEIGYGPVSVSRNSEPGRGAGDMRIRGHHLICVLSFDTNEFGDELAGQFISMRRTLLEKGRMIEVVTSPDDACAKCPYLSREGCASPADGPEDAVKALDRKALAALGMEPGLHPTDAIHRRYLNLDDAAFSNICSSCSFYGRSPCRARFMELTGSHAPIS